MMKWQARLGCEGYELGLTTLNETAAFGRAYNQTIELLRIKRNEYLASLTDVDDVEQAEGLVHPSPLDLKATLEGITTLLKK
jgi:hypothetical protein